MPPVKATVFPASQLTVEESAPVRENTTWPPGEPCPTAATLAVKVADSPVTRVLAFEVTATVVWNGGPVTAPAGVAAAPTTRAVVEAGDDGRHGQSHEAAGGSGGLHRAHAPRLTAPVVVPPGMPNLTEPSPCAPQDWDCL